MNKRFTPLLLAMLLVGCVGDSGDSGTVEDAARDTAPATAVDSEIGQRDRSVERDLTGDGQPERLRLALSGTEPGDLEVAFTVSSGGRELFSEDWNSRLYFVYAEPIEDIPPDSVRARVRDRVSEFFAAEKFGKVAVDDMVTPAIATDLIARQLAYAEALESLPDDMPEEEAELAAHDRANADSDRYRAEASAIWREMLDASLPTFVFFSGGEYTRTIAWSPSAGRFFSIWECC